MTDIKSLIERADELDLFLRTITKDNNFNVMMSPKDTRDLADCFLYYRDTRQSQGWQDKGLVEVCRECDIAGCKHIRARKANKCVICNSNLEWRNPLGFKCVCQESAFQKVVREAQEHYQKTGCYKPEDVHQLLGHPLESVSARNPKGLWNPFNPESKND